MIFKVISEASPDRKAFLVTAYYPDGSIATSVLRNRTRSAEIPPMQVVGNVDVEAPTPYSACREVIDANA